MKKNKIILGVIPARGGSKGVPRKNIRYILGKPLIAHAIECGQKCRSIDHLIVSTDSEEIADVARKYGAEVPFIRPAELASDVAPMLPVLQHSITACEEFYRKTVELLVLLDPTGPLRTPDDVEHCVQLCRNSQCDAVISGHRAHRNPYFNMVTHDGDFVHLVCSSPQNIGRRQDAPPVFDLNTVVWVYTRKALMEEEARIPKKTRLYVVPHDRALDLDTELDFHILEFLLRRMASD